MNRTIAGLMLFAGLGAGLMFLTGCFGVIAVEGEHGRMVAGAHVPGMTVAGAHGPHGGGLVVVKTSPPAPKHEKKSKRPGNNHEWIPGCWEYTGNHWTWKKGRWAPKPRVNAVWIAGRWAQQSGGWVYIQGRWDN